MTCISARKSFLFLSLVCYILCLSSVAHAQFPSPPSITLHLGDGFTNQYNDESPDNAILGQPMSGNITISGLSGNETARVQCYVNNYGLIYSETVSYNAYSTFTWTPSYLGATTAGCSLSVQSSTSQQYVLTENMPMTVFDKTPQVAIPQYKVLSLIYAAPGNSSSAGLTSGTTNGTSTSLGTNFSSGTSVTFSYKFVVASVSATFGVTDTNGQTNQTTDTFSNATGISNISNHTGPNTLNHNQDLFLLWLNPVVTVQQTSPTAIQYTYSLPSSANGVMDTVEVTAEAMEANAQGATTVPLAILLPQTYGSQTVPGVANICAHPLPANQCTQANQCGCVPSDFTTILAQDPLLQFSSTESPLQADAGGSTCGDLSANPTYADCRYVPVPESSQSPYQEILLLSGPDCSGCNSSGNSYVVTDATQKTLTYSGSSSATVGVSGSAGALGPTVSASHQWTWTDSESIGAINGNNSVMNVTLSSSTVGCDQNIPVFEDTVYHTFVFQQPADNTSCP